MDTRLNALRCLSVSGAEIVELITLSRKNNTLLLKRKKCNVKLLGQLVIYIFAPTRNWILSKQQWGTY